VALTRIISEIIENSTIENRDISASFTAGISGSWRGELSSSNMTVVGGGVSGSVTSTGSFGRVEAAGVVFADSFESVAGGATIDFNDNISLTGNLTATGNISSSFTSTGSFGRVQTTNIDIDSISGNWTNAGNTVADLGIITTADINGGTIDGVTLGTNSAITEAQIDSVNINGSTIKDFSSVSGSSVSTGSFGRVITSTADINGGTIDGITSLTAGGDLDIGAHGFRASTLTSDSQTSGRVAIYSTAGLLSEDSDLTFSGATLSATNVTTTGTIKDFASVSGSYVSTGSVGRIQTRAADIGTITGTTLSVTGNISSSATSTGSVGRLETQQTNASLGGSIINLAGNLTTAGTLTTQNNNVTINAAGAARTLTLNESLTVGDGHDGILTYSAASKTLTVENTSVVNQDLTSDASPTFAGGTVTGNLSVGGIFTAQEVHTEFESASVLFTSGSTRFGNDTTDIHRVTGSMDISGSLKLPHGDVTITDTLTATNIGAFNLTGKLTAGSTEIEGSAFDINGGTIDGITSLTAGGDLDIGAHDLRAATITADSLTATRVPFAGTAGVLSDDADLTFATATLSATNLTTTGTIKNMALVSGSSVSTGSFGRIEATTVSGSIHAVLAEFNSVDINGGTIDGITSLTAGGDLDIGAHDFRAATITADGLTATRVPFAGTAGLLSDDSDLTFATATLSATNLTTTGTIKNMALVSGSSVSTGSFGSIRSAGLPLRVSSDKVGIGTATPFVSHAGVASTMKLHLNGGTAASSDIGDNPILLLENRAGSAGNRYGINFRMHAGQTFGMAEIGAITENAGAQESGGIYFATKQDTTGDSRPTEVMRIDDSGNVGIGTATPGFAGNANHTTLSILNSDTTADADRPAVLELAGNNKGDGVRVGEINFWQDVDGGDDQIVSILGVQQGTTSNNVGGKLRLQTKADAGSLADRLVIGQDGKVGIGTVSPSQLLNVEAADGVSDNTWVTWLQNKEATDDRNYGLRISAGSTASDTAFFVQDHDASNDYFIIRGNGKVGIGTTSPDYLVEIEKANGDHTSTALSITNSQAGGYGSVLNFVSQRSDSTAHAVAASIRTQGEAAWDSDANTDSNLFFSTVLDNTLADKMKLNAAGNLDIGGRAYNSSTGGFYMNDGRIQNTITANSSGYEVMMFDNTTENGTVALLQYRTNAAAEGSIIADGSGLAISNNSDYRKKERITDLEGSLDAINSLQPRKYYYRKEFAKPRRAFAGFIAHEVQESQLPHLTTGVKDGVVTQEDLDNDLHSEKIVGDPAYQTVSYSGNEMITRLVGAVQELSEKVEAQQKEIEELKN